MLLSSRFRTMQVLCLLLLVVALMFSICESRTPVSTVSTQAHLSPHGPLQLFVSTIQEARRHLAAAAVARSVSIFTMYPVDTIKTRMQMGLPNPLRLAGLYKGVAGSLVGQVPYG